MNRPLPAFGALLTLLAVAMFAVSSTTRSTTVQPPLPANRRVKLQGERGRIELALVMPAGQIDCANRSDKGLAGDEDLCSPDSIEVHRVEIEVVDRLKPLATTTGGDRQALVPASIGVAQDALAALRSPAPMECRCWHDAVYDRAIYGASDNGAGRIEPALFESARVDDGELTSIFHDLVSRQPAKPRPEAGRTQLRGGEDEGESGRGEKGEINRRWQTGVSGARVEWAEYVDFADRVTSQVAATSESTGTSVAGRGVRSGDWLRHSAASGLHQMGLALQSAAVELSRDDGRSATSGAGLAAE